MPVGWILVGSFAWIISKSSVLDYAVADIIYTRDMLGYKYTVLLQRAQKESLLRVGGRPFDWRGGFAFGGL